MAPRPLLRFLDPWDNSSTLDVSLEQQLHASTDSFALEYTREIDALRRSTVMKQSSIADFPDDEHLKRFEQYLGHIRRISKRSDHALEFKYSWTCPLSGKHHHPYKLTGLQLEQAMAAFTMGSAMRSAAYLLTAAAAAGVDGLAPGETLPAAALSAAADNATSTAAGSYATASTLLRKAAGLYTWLAEVLLKQELVAQSLPADRPAELLPAMSACMRLMCLAEAQSITAHRAGQRGSKAATTSQLHLAASELFEEAARVLKSHAGEFKSLSDRLRRFLAISAATQKSKAQLWWGEELRLEGQAGQGEGCCLEAAAGLKECMVVAEGDAVWKHTLTQELATVEEFRLRCEKDRTGVYFQSLAKPSQSLPPAGKVLVTAIEYVPTESASQQDVDTALE